jgi:hypothetical protein
MTEENKENVKALPSVKYCKTCDEVKDISNFYKTGYKQFHGKNCKKCCNIVRQTYPIKKYPYIKKGRAPGGFFKLPAETQKNIKYDLYIKKTKKEIAKEYGLCYGTFLGWCKTIPAYTE